MTRRPGQRGGGKPAGRGERPDGQRSRPPQARNRSRGRGDGDRDAPTHDSIDPELLVYGRNSVREALRGRRRVSEVWVSDRAEVEPLGAKDVPVHDADRDMLDALAGSHDHQGLVARVERFPYSDPDELFAGERPFVLALDQVTDPHNLGAIARVCDAAGVDGILVPKHRSAHVTAAVCRASAGAIEHVKVAVCTNIADTLERHKGAETWVYGTSDDAELSYTNIDFASGVVIVLGSEGSGMRPRVRSTCDQLVSLPMAGKVSSLNVATVAAVLAFECVRQRAGAGEG